MSVDDAELHWEKGYAFSQLLLAEREYQAATNEREEAEYALIEAARLGRDAEHQASMRKAQIASKPPGKNAEERAAAMLILLEGDEEYRRLSSEAREFRATQAEIKPKIKTLEANMRRIELHMMGLTNIMGSP
tara:strand:+ start:169 stop:567 length:399 start_codon:yes stop_codon:yes gene_type:complete